MLDGYEYFLLIRYKLIDTMRNRILSYFDFSSTIRPFYYVKILNILIITYNLIIKT